MGPGAGLRQARVHRDQNRAELKRRRSFEFPDDGWTERGRRDVAYRMWAPRARTQRRRKGRGSTASETVRARPGAQVWARFWGRRRWWRRGRGGGSNLEMVAKNWNPFRGIGVQEEEIILRGISVVCCLGGVVVEEG